MEPKTEGCHMQHADPSPRFLKVPFVDPDKLPSVSSREDAGQG